MPRPPRAGEAGGLYHALNRGNLRADIFLKDADFAAFERILHEALQIHQVELYAYQLMSNHYHLEQEKVSGTYLGVWVISTFPILPFRYLTPFSARG